jgi:hypothetical protein
LARRVGKWFLRLGEWLWQPVRDIKPAIASHLSPENDHSKGGAGGSLINDCRALSAAHKLRADLTSGGPEDE